MIRPMLSFMREVTSKQPGKLARSFHRPEKGIFAKAHKDKIVFSVLSLMAFSCWFIPNSIAETNNLKMPQQAVAVAAAAPVAVQADATCADGSKTVFSCMTKRGKRIELCDAGATLKYSFGKPQSNPDIVVKVPRDAASTSQWAGIGRDESYSVDIPNGNTTYSVFWSLDHYSDKHAVEAGVNVVIKNKLAATVTCSENGMVNKLEGIDLKPSE